MKTIETFADEVIKKARRMKKRKGIIGAICSVCAFGLLTFLVLFSNIINFDGIDAHSKAYKKYMQSYVSAAGEEYASLKILDSQSAAFSFGGELYLCSLNEESESSFRLTVQSDGEEENEELTVDFSEQKATVEGSVDDKRVAVVLNLTEDVENVPAGVWTMFARGNADGTISETAGQNWIVLLENGDAYCGEGSTTWICEFVSVGDRIITYTRDQQSGVAELSLLEVIPDQQFGYTVLRGTLYERENKTPFVPYYRLMPESEAFEYEGGSFDAKYVDVVTVNERIDESELYSLADINWRLLPASSSDEADDPELKLDLAEDGKVMLNGKKAGVWLKLRDKPLVILDKKHDLLGRAFTLYADSFISAELSESALTFLDVVDVYKVGYHTFRYYELSKQTTVYWGSLYNKADMKKELVYDEEYVSFGYTMSLDKETGEFVTADWASNGKYSIIFHEDRTCEFYANGRKSSSSVFTIDEKTRSINILGNFRIPVSGSSLNGDLVTQMVSVLDIGAGKLNMNTTQYDENGVIYLKTRNEWRLRRSSE